MKSGRRFKKKKRLLTDLVSLLLANLRILLPKIPLTSLASAERVKLKKNVLRWIVFLCLVVPVLLACQKQTEKPTGPLEKITIAYTTLPHPALFHLAFVKDFFSAEGLDVTPQGHQFGKLALASVVDGKADFATPADTPIMFAITEGKKVCTIAVIATSSRSGAIVARKDLGIEKDSDLKGKRIGVTLGTVGDFFVDSFLAARGIEREEVKMVDMRPDKMPDALMKGEVDAVSTWNPSLKGLQLALGKNGLTFRDDTLCSETFCIAAMQEFVKSHPETVKKVLRALIKAETFLRGYPEESRRLVAEFIKTDRSLLDEIWDSYDFRVSLDQSLIVSLEEQTRWARKNRQARSAKMPNYLDFIYFDGLQSVKPEAVSIIR